MDEKRAANHGYTEEEDLEILFSDKARLVEELSHDDDDDTDVKKLSKQNWIAESKKLWDLKNINEIRSRVKQQTLCLVIHVYGSVGEGYGAILRDYQLIPIAGRSRFLPDSVSEFYIRLNAVALAAKIALDYQVLDFFLYVPSFYLYNFVRSIWNPYSLESNPDDDHKYDLIKSLLHPEDKEYIEDIHRLTLSILDDLNLLRCSGIKYFAVQPIFKADKNNAAKFLAKLGEDRDMKFAEICGNEKLSDILYEDIFL